MPRFWSFIRAEGQEEVERGITHELRLLVKYCNLLKILHFVPLDVNASTTPIKISPDYMQDLNCGSGDPLIRSWAQVVSNSKVQGNRDAPVQVVEGRWYRLW